jgi:hypothetical protein
MIQPREDSARKLPFFARYLVGQEVATTEAAKSEGRDTKASKYTLKFPSDWDDWDTD